MILTSCEQSVLIRFGETTCQKGKAQWREAGTSVTKQSLYCCFMFTLAQSYCIQFSNALVLQYTYRCMHIRKCGVTTRHVVNWISGPRAAMRAHTPKSCTYNTFMYISFGEIQKISLYFTGKVTGVRRAICQRNYLTNFGQILLYG